MTPEQADLMEEPTEAPEFRYLSGSNYDDREYPNEVAEHNAALLEWCEGGDANA